MRPGTNQFSQGTGTMRRNCRERIQRAACRRLPRTSTSVLIHFRQPLASKLVNPLKERSSLQTSKWRGAQKVKNIVEWHPTVLHASVSCVAPSIRGRLPPASGASAEAAGAELSAAAACGASVARESCFRTAGPAAKLKPPTCLGGILYSELCVPVAAADLQRDCWLAQPHCAFGRYVQQQK